MYNTFKAVVLSGFLSVSEAIMLNPIQKIENSALTRKSHKTNEQKMHKCKVELDKHTSFL